MKCIYIEAWITFDFEMPFNWSSNFDLILEFYFLLLWCSKKCNFNFSRKMIFSKSKNLRSLIISGVYNKLYCSVFAVRQWIISSVRHPPIHTIGTLLASIFIAKESPIIIIYQEMAQFSVNQFISGSICILKTRNFHFNLKKNKFIIVNFNVILIRVQLQALF